MTIEEIRSRLADMERALEELAEDGSSLAACQDMLAALSEIEAQTQQESNKNSNSELHLRLYSVEAALYLLKGQPRSSLVSIVAAHTYILDTTKPLYRAKLLAVEGKALFTSSDYRKSMDCLSQAYDILESLGNAVDMAAVLGGIGQVHVKLGHPSKGLEYHQRSLVLYQELGLKRAIAFTTGNLGLAYNKLAEYESALDCYRRAVALHEELGMQGGVARVLGNMGTVYAHLARYNEALECMRGALAVYEELGMKKGAASLLANIGAIYKLLSEFSEALEYLNRALAIEEEIANRAGISGVLGNIGSVLTSIGEYSQALDYYSRALALNTELGLKAAETLSLGNIGFVYTRLGDYPKALEYSLHCLESSRQIADRRMEGYALRFLAEAYLRLNDSQKARECLDAALDLGRNTIRSENGVSEILILQAELELSELNADAAHSAYAQALEMSAKLGEREQEQQASTALATMHAAKGDYERAYAHMLRSVDLGSQINVEAARKKSQAIEYERRQAVERAAAEATTGLLHKVLPASIATRMIKGEHIADYFESISILFADIVGFTPLASLMRAEDVLAVLNHVFAEIDAIMRKHDCQKIKTIGDGYMAVCGAPLPCEDHAEKLARAALELMNTIDLPEHVRRRLPPDSVFSMRVGLHTGPAFAGIIGDNGFVYDVYSDAVNLASRMESGGVAGHIHCSADFAQRLLSRDASFIVQERGEIDVKGKGRMTTYFLEKTT